MHDMSTPRACVWLCYPCPQIYYNDTRIQLLDLPGIIEGAAYGRGRGREVRSLQNWK